MIDLNDDCQLLVLNHLDFTSLLHVAETNGRYKALASEILKAIFREKMLDITLLHPEQNPEQTPRWLIYDDYIRIENFTMVERVVKNFGHLIQKLRLESIHTVMEPTARSIYKLINTHCSKSLNEITLHSAFDNFLDEFTNTFERVQSINIRDNLKTERRLNEIFPSVRQLEFHTYRFINPDAINVKYKYLEHLTIHLYNIPSFLLHKWATELFTKNSQIRSLKLLRPSGQYMKIAADLLPELENLELDTRQFVYDSESINFLNVKELTVKGPFVHTVLSNVQFGNVVVLNLGELTETLFGETGFFTSNKHLKKLRLMPFTTNSVLFEQFARTKTTLQEIFIGDVRSIKLERIFELIDNNAQLDKLEIEFLNSIIPRTDLNTLRSNQQISNNWSISEFETKLILKNKFIVY